MPRILQICNTDFAFNKFLNPLVNALISQGFEVECICSGGNISHKLIKGKVKFHDVDFPKSSNPIFFIRAIIKVYQIIRNGNYDIVNSHNRNASIVGRVACFLVRRGKKKPVNIYTARGMYFHDAQAPLAYKSTLLLERVLSLITDLTLSQSQEDVDLMSSRFLFFSNKIRHIANGINVDMFNPLIECGGAYSKKNQFVVATTGRIVKGKGMLDLLEAFNYLVTAGYDANLLIIGGNIKKDIEPYCDRFMHQVAKYDLLKKVQITGMVEDVECYLKHIDVFVLPSYREGVPRSLIEAMSMTKIVVATNIRGAREIIQDGENGYLYSPHESKELFNILKKILHLKENEKITLQNNARNTVKARFCEQEYIKLQVGYIIEEFENSKD